MPTRVVQCQSERSQHSNKESAMKILRSKLVELAEQRKDKLKEIERQSEIGWGNQIALCVLSIHHGEGS